MSLKDLPLSEFITTTASSEPVPGGGSIAALCGALASALGRMVCALTLGRKKYADVQDDVAQIATRIDSALMPVFLHSIDSDSQAYDRVFSAYKLPKETDEERAARTEAIQQALRGASFVPMDVVEAILRLLPHLETLARIGNRNAISDVYVASLCARTAGLGAAANVRINLQGITDETYVADTRAFLAHAEKTITDTTDSISSYIQPLL